MKRIINSTLTDEQMTAELNEHFNKLNEAIVTFQNKRPTRRNCPTFECEYSYIEHHSIDDMIWLYISDFNQSWKETGNGFDSNWDEDMTVSILYKDGSIRNVNQDWDDGTKRIKLDGIDSIIVDSGWGTAYAGPHVRIYNYRESVAYRPEDKYGYKSVEERYNDFDDLRLDFDI